MRIFRLFRVKKYASFIDNMKMITTNIREELIVLLFYTMILLILLSFAIYEFEHNAQPEVFSNIFQTMWWAVATLTTVGYGDIYPITAMGKLITAFISVIGIAFVAIPGGMFASEFMSEINKNKEKKNHKSNDICLRCNSTNIELHTKDNEKDMHICKECKFTWLDS
jgi:voltage-gated potassium channel